MLQVINSKRTVIATVMSVVVLVVIYGWMITTTAIGQGALPPVPAGGGNVNTYNATVNVTPTIQASSYVSTNAIGSLQTVPAFRSTGRPSGLLNGISLTWKGTEVVAATFYVFDTLPTATTCTDKAVFSLGAADMPKLATAPFVLTSAATLGSTLTSAFSVFTQYSIQNHDASPTVNLYVCIVSGTTFTPAVGDLSYKVKVLQD
jgi:hypothetical protein